jgi:hypothetical protein
MDTTFITIHGLSRRLQCNKISSADSARPL